MDAKHWFYSQSFNGRVQVADIVKEYFDGAQARERLKKHLEPRIKTEQHYSDEWSAVDDRTYDGPGSKIGWGKTEQEAIDDLLDKIQEGE